jgi:hypothetical protein
VKAEMETDSRDHEIACYMVNLVYQAGSRAENVWQGMGNQYSRYNDRCEGTEEQDICQKSQFSIPVPTSPGQGPVPLPVKPGMEKEEDKEYKGKSLVAHISYIPVVQKGLEMTEACPHPRRSVYS